MAADVERRLGDIPLLTQAECEQIARWNSTEIQYPVERCVHQYFEAQADRTPDAVALVYEHETVSYGELNTRSNRLANYMKDMGVRPEVRVGICLERSVEMVVGLLSILKAGAAYVPLDPHYPKERLLFILEDASINLLVTEESLRDLFPRDSFQQVCVHSAWAEIEKEGGENLQTGVESGNLAYAIYTSGSTGKPKGVMVRHDNVANFFAGMDSVVPIEPGDTWLAVTSISFDISVLELFWTLGRGLRVVIQREQFRELQQADARDRAPYLPLPAQIVRNGVTHLQCTPSMARVLALEAGQLTGTDPLRRLIIGGEALPISLAKQLCELSSATMQNMYGPTETSIWSTTWVADNLGDAVPIGQPIANTQIRLLDEHGQQAPVGNPAEIFIGGEGVARGYIDEPQLTAERFIPDQFSTRPGARLYRTGDIARYGEDGNIEYLGRTDHQIKIRGFRIELGEIESRLSEHTAVEQVVVIADNEEAGERRLIAYLVAGDKVKPDELREHLRARLPEYMVPSAFIQMEQLPLTANGKIDRRALPKADASVDATAYVGPRNAVEEILCGIWAASLRIEQVGIGENFFELGGHSLLATQVISRIRDLLDVDVPLRALFENPTVAGLAEAVERERRAGRRAEAPPIVAVSRSRELPLSFAQQRLWFIQQLEPDSAAYNVLRAVRLRGELDLHAVKHSLQEIVSRHEVLRTRFEMREGQPLQVIDEPSGIDLPLWDLSELEAEEREQRARELTNLEAARAFDLERGPVWRAAALRLGAQDHVLVLNIHHISSDAWSTGVLVNEFTALYEGYTGG